MVLEVLINPTKATGNFREMFLIGVLYSLVGAALGFFVFRSYVSIVMVAFTTIAGIPFVHGALRQEAGRGGITGATLLQKHGRISGMILAMFLGFVIVYTALFTLLPADTVSQLFQAQKASISDVRSAVAGSAAANAATGNFFSLFPTIAAIVANNAKVLFFCLLFSLLYGAGVLFILAWNASVMGAAIGSAILGGAGKPAIITVTQSMLGYFLHGIPEIMAYLVGGIAGGILSVAVVRHGIRSPAFRTAAMDSMHLTFFAVILLIISAIVEVTLSPALL